MLGASFFFSRGDGSLCDPQLIFPTLAFRSAQSDAFKRAILDVVEEDAGLRHKKFLPRLEELILKLLKTHPNRRHTTLVVLDALDASVKKGYCGNSTASVCVCDLNTLSTPSDYEPISASYISCGRRGIELC